MTEPNIVRTETCKILSYRDDKQSNVEEVELELIAKLVPYLWNEDGDKISFAVICVRFWLTQGDHIPSGCNARRAFIPIESANVDYADKVYKRFKF